MNEGTRTLRYPLSGKDVKGNMLLIPGKGWEVGKSVEVKVTFNSPSLVFTRAVAVTVGENGEFIARLERQPEDPLFLNFHLRVTAAYGYVDRPTEAGISFDALFGFTA